MNSKPNSLLMHLFIIILAILPTKKVDSDLKCNSETMIIAQNYTYSDFSMVRNVFEPFVYYSVIHISNTYDTIVPDYLFANFCANQIFLTNNHIRIYTNKSLAGMVNVSELSITRNQVESIDELILGLDTNTLTKLDLSYNRIQMLTTKFTSYFANVKNLNLAYNNISFIGDFLFENMRSLQSLIFRGNNIKIIKNFKFAGLYNLTELRLQQNSIKEIESDAFKDLISLSTLDLGENIIENLNNSLINLLMLTSLYLQSNKLKSNELQSLPNSKNLFNIDLSKNQFNQPFTLETIKNARFLILDYNPLKFLTSHEFSQSKSLTYLSIKQSKIKYIQIGTFSYSFASLNMLDLSYNYLEVIEVFTFIELSNLESLYLDYNVISEIEPLAFLNLKFLSITHNLLKNIPDDLFKNMISVQEIFLSYNKLRVIKSQFFQDLASIEHLYFKGNLIEDIEKEAFSQNTNLTILDLSLNKLKEIKEHYFNGLSNLTVLDLSGNMINYIEKGSFKDFMNIKRIDLSDNFIISIDQNSFANINTSLIDLSKNQLDTFDSNIFTNVNTERFSISENYLKILDKGSLQSLSQCSFLNFSSNQLEFISNDLFGDLISKATVLYLYRNRLLGLSFLKGKQFLNLVELDISYNLLEDLLIEDIISLSNLKVLNIGHNKIKFIEHGFFEKFSLSKLNLTNISIPLNISFSNIDVLDISLNKVIDYEFLKHLKGLKGLYLRKLNLNLSNIDFSLFQSLISLDLSENIDVGNFSIADLKLLEKLSLTYMQLKSINTLGFDHFEKLNYLNLSNNLIFRIEQSNFNSLKNLRVLDLSNNLISWIDKETFNNFNYLDYLNLGNNKMKYIYIYSLTYLSQLIVNRNMDLVEFHVIQNSFHLFRLQKLDLSSNSLQLIELSLFFDKQSELEDLYLNGNKLANIDDNLLICFFELEELNLDSNLISSIDGFSFQNLEQLEFLSIGNNSLSYLDEFLFSNLYHLKYLNLSYNSIEYLKNQLFSNLYNLETLDLSFNRLKSIDDSILQSLSLLKDFYVSNNHNGLSFSDNCFLGLESIVNLFISFENINDDSNKRSLMNSLKPHQERLVNEVAYFKSINIIYQFNEANPEMNCTLVLEFLSHNIQVNLKSDYDFILFLSFCRSIDLFN